MTLKEALEVLLVEQRFAIQYDNDSNYLQVIAVSNTEAFMDANDFSNGRILEAIETIELAIESEDEDDEYYCSCCE